MLVAVEVGCSDDDARTQDAGHDAAVTALDGATANLDAALQGNDAGATSTDAGTCALHLPTGFTQVIGSATDGDLGRGVSMVLDENDDPLFAYLVFGLGDATLTFTRWDPCVGAFTAPLDVDHVGAVSDGHGERQVSLAYDVSRKQVGIAYQKIIADPGANDAKTIWLATRSFGAASFGVQQVSEGVSGDANPTTTPSLALGDGKAYLAYAQNNYQCGGSCTGLWFLEGSATAASGASLTFSHAAIPYGGAVAQPRLDSVSLALDGAGTPGVAFYVDADAGYTTSLLFWKKGLVEAVLVTDSNNVQNDAVDVSLRFDGLKPRVAGHLIAAPSSSYDLTYVDSDNGSTWHVPVRLPQNGSSGTAFSAALAVGPTGQLAVAADINTGSGDNPCNNPYLARSSDGQSWTACGADTAKAHAYGADALNAAFGRTRSAGKLALGFQNSNADSERAGIVYWQEQ